MNELATQRLSQFLAAVASAAPDAQAHFDASWREDSNCWRAIIGPLVRSCPAGARRLLAELLAPTVPSRQLLQSYQLEAHVRFEHSERTGFAIGVWPIELGWESIHGTTLTSASRFTLSVECVPLSAHPRTACGFPFDDPDPLTPKGD